VVIDEAQQVPAIGMTLKRIVDNFPDVQLLVTGSSAFDLQNKLNEPLTGRKYEYHLYPLSISELYDDKGLIFVRQTLDQRLIFGAYPDIVNHPEEAEDSILDIANSYLYKDLLRTDNVRRPVLLNKLLKALAFQVGSEVSYNEVAQTIGTDNKTVEKYIDLLEKCYVVFRVEGLSRNLRNELKKGKKVYFYDNGVRNAVIQSFAPLDLRHDLGALWKTSSSASVSKEIIIWIGIASAISGAPPRNRR
jgi:predicted AAA+ superfamily ATPase